MTTAEHASFTIVRRGYDSTQVDEHVDMLSMQLRAATAAHESALTQVQAPGPGHPTPNDSPP